MVDNVTFTVVIYRRVVHFLTSLNAEKHCSVLCLFFNEHELCAKTTRSYVYFLTSMNYVLKLLDNLVYFSFFTINSFAFSNIVLYAQLLHQTS